MLAVPLDVAFRFQGIDPFNGQIKIRWLFGLMRFRIQVPTVTQEPPTHAAAGSAAKPSRPKGKAGGGRALAILLRQAAFRRRIYRLARELVEAAHPHDLGLRMRLGLGDPADTGRLWAWVGPLGLAADGLRNARVSIEPEFMDAVFEFEAQGRLLLMPLRWLLLVMAFLVSPASIRAWRALSAAHD